MRDRWGDTAPCSFEAALHYHHSDLQPVTRQKANKEPCMLQDNACCRVAVVIVITRMLSPPRCEYRPRGSYRWTRGRKASKPVRASPSDGWYGRPHIFLRRPPYSRTKHRDYEAEMVASLYPRGLGGALMARARDRESSASCLVNPTSVSDGGPARLWVVGRTA